MLDLRRPKLDKFIFETSGDAHRRLTNGIVMYDGSAVRVEGVSNADGEPSDQCVDPSTINVHIRGLEVPLTSPLLDYENYPFGFVDYRGAAVFVCRNQRRNQLQSLCSSNTSCRMVSNNTSHKDITNRRTRLLSSDINIVHTDFMSAYTKCLMQNKYVSVSKALSLLHGSNPRYSIPVSPNFSLFVFDGTTYIDYMATTVVGIVDEHPCFFNESDYLYKRFIEECTL